MSQPFSGPASFYSNSRPGGSQSTRSRAISSTSRHGYGQSSSQPGLPLEQYPRIRFSDEEQDLLGENDNQFDGFDERFSSPPINRMGRSQPRNHLNTTPTSNQSMLALLQSQQAQLERVLSNQELFRQRQDSVEEKLKEVEAKISTSNTPESSSTDSGSKRKKLVTRALSAKVSKVHSAGDLQFKPDESSCSEHNQSVKRNIMKEICSQSDNSHTEEIVKVAVKRCYETCRRGFREDQEGMEEVVGQQAKKRKYRSRRQRTFDKRSSVVRPDAEMKKWELLSYLYMTELSDDPNDENAFIERHLPWRSQKLNDYIKILDQRLQEKERKDLCGAVSKKLRTLGHPSEQKKPVGPAWAIAAESTAPDGHPTALSDSTNKR